MKFAMLSLCALSSLAAFAKTDQPTARKAVTPKENAHEKSPDQEPRLTYPKTRASDQVDDYHGTKVADPYRWLEDPNSDETKAWITEQNKVTRAFLDAIPAREAIRSRLTELWNYERFGIPSQYGGRYFYSRNDGLQNQSVLYWAPSLDATPTVLLDPNALSQEGTVAISGTAISDDGQWMAYGLAAAGSDWQEWRVRDIAKGKDLADHLQWIKFSGASWTPDGRGFYYSRFDEPAPGASLTEQNYYQKLYFHRLGDPQSEDQLVYERKDEKEWGFGGQVSEDGAYLIISVSRGTERKNQLFYLDLKTPGAKVVELLAGFDAQYVFIGNEGPVFWFLTDKDAPRYRLIAIDTTKPEAPNWREIVPESRDLLEGASVVGDRFFCQYLADARSQVKVFGLDGKPQGEVSLPGVGTVAGFDGKRKDTETFYSFTGFTSASTIYRYEPASGKTSVFRAPKVAFDESRFETKQVFYKSKDGARVPLFIVHKRGLRLDGRNPTLLYGYGGFNISMSPSFSAGRIAWLEMGGVYAMPNLRGGGEYGREWHESGMLDRKQNVFDDFIAAAEWLIENKYTSSDKLAISGGSNGGLLVGACMTQRPELFAAALPAVGVMDMLRYQKFTIGWAWVNEFGSSDDPDQFAVIHKYSPLHNLRPGTKFPATLVTTSDHDDRVVPAHSFKFAATLQNAHSGSSPTLIRIETSAGHGAGTPTEKLIDALADTYAFLVKTLGIDVSLGKEATPQ